MMSLQPLGHDAHFGVRLSECDTGFKPSEYRQIAIGPVSAPGFLYRIKCEWNPELSKGGKLESRRHNANHSITLTIELNRLIDQGWIAAKLALPQTMAQQNDMIGPDLFFFREKAPSQRGHHVQGRNQVGGDLCGCDSLWLATASKVECGILRSRQLLKDGLVLLPIQEVWNRHCDLSQTTSRIALPN